MKLYEYQSDGIAWLRSPGSVKFLWDDQGLGKTVQVLSALDSDSPVLPHLVVCPAAVAFNWAAEAAKWAPRLKVAVVAKTKDKVPEDADLVITTYSVMRTPGVFRQLLSRSWGVLVCDEAHALKNPKAARTQRILGKPGDPRFACLHRLAAATWLLTGTPMPNNPTELWAPVCALAPQLACEPGSTKPMTWWQWRSRYCDLQPVPWGDGWKIVGARNTAELRSRLAPLYLRRKKTDVLNLPPIRWSKTVVTVDEMPDEVLEIEAELVAQGADTPEKLLEALRQSEAYPVWRRLCGLAKTPAIADILEDELESGAIPNVVIMAHHLEVIELLRTRLAEFHPITITGADSAESRTRKVSQFQAQGKHRVLIGQISAAGVGITLTAAADLVFAEMSYTPGDNAQAADRVYRIGQTRSVHIRTMHASGSVDERVAEILLTKQEMISQVVR